MFKNLSVKLIALLFALVLILTGIVATLKRKVETLSEERSQAIEFANTQTKAVSIYKTKWNNEAAQVQVLQLSLNNAKELVSNERIAFVRQFSGINKRLNNLEQISTTTATIIKEWQLPLRDTTLVNIDSTILHGKTFSYSDSLNRIYGIVQGNQIIPKIEITVPLQGAVHWERKRVLGLRVGRKQWFSDITSTNPLVKIRQHELIKVSRK